MDWRKFCRTDEHPDYWAKESEFNCFWCGKPLNHEDVIWADDEGNLTTGDISRPWCASCLPNEVDYDETE